MLDEQQTLRSERSARISLDEQSRTVLSQFEFVDESIRSSLTSLNIPGKREIVQSQSLPTSGTNRVARESFGTNVSSHVLGSSPRSAGGYMIGTKARTHKQTAPFFIGVAGGTASGKTSLCDQVAQRLNDTCVVLLSQDSFYKELNEEESAQARMSNYNFDHPNAFDLPLLLEVLNVLKQGKPANVPIYDFTRHARDPGYSKRVEPADVIIIEGILVLHMPEVRDMLQMKIFVDTDDDLRLGRRIQRDIAERGRDVVGVIEQYTKFVKPAFDLFIGPSRRHADIIIPWSGRTNNLVAVDLVTEHIRGKLQQPELRRFFPNLHVIPSSFQIRAMHTTLRSKTTTKNEFVFVADRLIRLVVEAGLGFLPFIEKTIETPAGAAYCGVESVSISSSVCGVSIIRSGESMENALRACCQGIKLGKILVTRSKEGKVGELLWHALPLDIGQRHVLLMDPILSTGEALIKAIELLIDQGVHESKILLLTIIAAPEGVQTVCSRYPYIKVITSEIESHIDVDHYTVIPGCGNFGDRYFCE